MNNVQLRKRRQGKRERDVRAGNVPTIYAFRPLPFPVLEIHLGLVNAGRERKGTFEVWILYFSPHLLSHVGVTPSWGIGVLSTITWKIVCGPMALG